MIKEAGQKIVRNRITACFLVNKVMYVEQAVTCFFCLNEPSCVQDV